jgi:hypothetical protein
MASIVSNVSLEADDMDGDESSDDKLSSLQKFFSPTKHPPGNPPRSHSLNQSIQTDRSSATTPLGLMSTPRKRLFKNVPEWSLFQYPLAQASTPKYEAEANNENGQSRLMILEFSLAAS